MEETAGKEDPVELDSSLPLLNILGGVEYLGGFADDEIPELSMLFYLSRYAKPCRPRLRPGARPVLVYSAGGSPSASLARETSSGGEFGWGGTHVKR